MKKKKLIRLLKVENKVLRQEIVKMRLMLYLTQDDELPLRKWSDDATTTTAVAPQPQQLLQNLLSDNQVWK